MVKAWVIKSYVDKNTRQGVLFGSQVELDDERFKELSDREHVAAEDKLPKKLRKLFLGEELSDKDKKQALKQAGIEDEQALQERSTQDPNISKVVYPEDTPVTDEPKKAGKPGKPSTKEEKNFLD